MRRTATALAAAILGAAILVGCGGTAEKAESFSAAPSPRSTRLSLLEARKDEMVLRPVRAALDAWRDVAFREDAPTEAWERLEVASTDLGKATKIAPEELSRSMAGMSGQITEVLEKRWTGGEVEPAEFHTAVGEFKRAIKNPSAFKSYTEAYDAWLSKRQKEDTKNNEGGYAKILSVVEARERLSKAMSLNPEETQKGLDELRDALLTFVNVWDDVGIEERPDHPIREPMLKAAKAADMYKAGTDISKREAVVATTLIQADLTVYYLGPVE
ncbi:hypothetical protein [Streptomyces celluloflavus]|uniref:hypothetical protein n=1 Tax=Streptomyces celluloflavus TaxID=58344 RepID=UPI0036CA053A